MIKAIKVALDFISDYTKDTKKINCKAWKRYNRETKEYGQEAQCEVVVPLEEDEELHPGVLYPIDKKFVDVSEGLGYPDFKVEIYKKRAGNKSKKIIVYVCDDYDVEEYDEYIYDV